MFLIIKIHKKQKYRESIFATIYILIIYITTNLYIKFILVLTLIYLFIFIHFKINNILKE